MARLSLALPIFARCERPRAASVRTWRLQPGRLAQGPDEKCGVTGRTPGICCAILIHPCRWAPFVGEGCPAAANKEAPAVRQDQRSDEAGANQAAATWFKASTTPSTTSSTRARS